MHEDVSTLVVIQRFVEILEDNVYSCAHLLVTVN